MSGTSTIRKIEDHRGAEADHDDGRGPRSGGHGEDHRERRRESE